MKTVNKILKVLATIAAIIGIVYVIATYGDKIVAWANSMIDRFFDKRTRFFDIEEQMEAEEAVPAEEATEEAAPAPEAADPA